MGDPVNAVQGTVTSHLIEIKEENVAPRASIAITQNNKAVTTVYSDGGMVDLTANIVDPNPADVHSFDWSQTHNNLQPPSDSNATFSFDPSLLSEGLFNLAVTVSDDGDGSLSGTAKGAIRVIASEPTLNNNVDSDNDGITDADEGAGDSDRDRVPDYLDSVAELHQLHADDEGAVVQTETGKQLRLGETAFAAGNAHAFVSMQDLADHGGIGGGTATDVVDGDYQYHQGIYDFEVTGVGIGDSVRVVLPQSVAILANASYRKYLPGTGWSDFVEDANNTIASARGALGVCPAPGDASYTAGLVEGNFCVQLTIEDGGPNDTDGLANGVVRDPGGVGVQQVPAPVVSVATITLSNTSFNSGDGEKVVLGFMLTSDSADAKINQLVIGASGEMSETGDVGQVRLYRDDNKNGIPEAAERLTEGRYAVDDGSITFLLPVAYQLLVGDTHFLITYQF